MDKPPQGGVRQNIFDLWYEYHKNHRYTYVRQEGVDTDSIWGWGQVGEQRVGDSNCVAQYFVRSVQGDRGSTTHPAAGQCRNWRTAGDEGDGGGIHMLYRRLLFMGVVVK